MNRWTHRLTLAALLAGPLFLVPNLLGQTRGDNPPKTGQAEPRRGRAVPRDDDDKRRAEQDRKREDDKREAEERRRRDEERRRAEERRHRGQTVHPGHVVFVGGYFYDTYYGPFPWWPPVAYPIGRFPVIDGHAILRIDASPKQAAVYVDGFYAGIVNDFDGIFQPLRVLPGGHTVALYLQGYRTVNRSIYLPPSATFRLREALLPLAPGMVSELPRLAPPLPEPPAGSYIPVRTPPLDQPLPPAVVRTDAVAPGFGILSMRVQPETATVAIDGERWWSAREGELVVYLTVGRHSVSVTVPGRTGFASEIEIRENETTELNVSVPPTPRGTR